MSKTVLTILMSAILLATAAPPAAAQNQQSIWRSWFPELFKEKNTGPDPAQTLRAPFAEEQTMPAHPPSPTIPEWQGGKHKTTFDKPHLIASQLELWLKMAIPDIMSFDTHDYDSETLSKITYFTEQGWRDYKNFLKTSNMENAIRSSEYIISTVVDSLPSQLNKGALNEQYKWLYEIEGLISYKNPYAKDYRQALPVSQKIKLRVQLTRTPAAQNDEGILIEQLTGTLHSWEPGQN